MILGTAGFGGFGSSLDLIGHGESDDEAARIMDAAWEAGIDTFDTADAYAGGQSERAIGKWMRSRNVRPILATKTFHPMVEGADAGLSASRIRRQVESSLERLGVDFVDLYLTHQADPDTPLAETLDALDDLVAEGLIGAYGGSHLSTEILTAASGRYGWVQNEFSLLHQRDLDDLLPLVARDRLGYTPYSPLAGGWLTGKYRANTPPPAGSRMAIRPIPYTQLDRPSVWTALETFREYADSLGTSMTVLAYAWVLSFAEVTAVLVGPRRPEQLAPAVAALAFPLDAETRQEITNIFNQA